MQRNVAEVINAAVKVGMDNTTTFVGLGGGVINNICGFSAACYQGGVNYIQIPTTFRAQVLKSHSLGHK
jgi:3-dehydroquinate synthase